MNPSSSASSASSSLRSFPPATEGDPLSQVASRSTSAALGAVRFNQQMSPLKKSSEPFSDDPKIFFEKFKVDPSLFDPQDVQCLRELFRSTKLSQVVCLFDLIGLKIYALIEKLSKDWPKKETEEIAKKDWSFLYMQVFLSFSRETLEKSFPCSKATPSFFLSFKTLDKQIAGFIDELKAIAEEHIRRKRSDQPTIHRSKAGGGRNRFDFLQTQTTSQLAELDGLKKNLAKMFQIRRSF